MSNEIKTGEFGLLEVLNSGKVHPLKLGSVVIGSSLDAKIRLRGKGVQDLHCRVNVHDNRLATLTPQSALFPTTLNGKVLRKAKDVLLKPGDMFVIGDTKILYRNDTLTAQELQQQKTFIKPIFNTPRRGSAIMRHACLTNSIKKKYNLPAFRYLNAQRKQPVNNDCPWETDAPVPESLVPSESSVTGEPVEEDAAVFSEPDGEVFQQNRVSKSGSTTSHGTRDSNDMFKRKSANVIIFDTPSKTPKNSIKKIMEKSYSRLSAEEAPDFPMSDEETPKAILNFSESKQHFILGKPKQFSKARSLFDLTSPGLLSKSEKRAFTCNKSFGLISSMAETPTTIFRTPTSATKGISKLKKREESVEWVTPSPDYLSSRSSSLSTALRQSADKTLEQSVAEDAEQTPIFSTSIRSRQSRQPEYVANNEYEDDDRTKKSLFEGNNITRRSRNLIRHSTSRVSPSRKSVNDTLNKSTNQQIVSSENLPAGNINRRYKRSLSVTLQPSGNDTFNKSVKVDQTPTASDIVGQRSRSLVCQSANLDSPQRKSVSDVLNESARQQVVSSETLLSRSITNRRSRRSLAVARSSENNSTFNISLDDDQQTPSTASDIVGRRSRSLVHQSANLDSPQRKSVSDVLNKSANQQVVSSETLPSPSGSITNRRSRRSLAVTRSSGNNSTFNKSLDDDQQTPSTAADIIGHRSRSLVCPSANLYSPQRKSMSDVLNELAYQQVVSSETLPSPSRSTTNRRSRKSLAVARLSGNNSTFNKSLDDDQQTPSTAADIIGRRSRSLVCQSANLESPQIKSMSDILNELSNQQVVSSETLPSPSGSITNRRSRRSLAVARSSGNNSTFNKSLDDDQQTPSTAADINGRRSRSLVCQSTNLDSPQRKSVSDASNESVNQQVVSSETLPSPSRSMTNRRSRSLTVARLSGNNSTFNKSLKDYQQTPSTASDQSANRVSPQRKSVSDALNESANQQRESFGILPSRSITNRRSRRSLAVSIRSSGNNSTFNKSLEIGQQASDIGHRSRSLGCQSASRVSPQRKSLSDALNESANQQKVSSGNVSPKSITNRISRRSFSVALKPSANSTFNKSFNLDQGTPSASNNVGHRSSILLPKQYKTDALVASTSIVSSRRSGRSVLVPPKKSETLTPTKLSTQDIDQKVTIIIDSPVPSDIGTRRSKSLSLRRSGNIKSFSSSVFSDENEAVIDSSLNSEISADFSSLESIESSSVESTDSSSFVYLNSPPLAPALDISGVGKLSKSPKQVLPPRNSRSSVKSGRRRIKTEEPSVSSPITLSTTVECDSSFSSLDDMLEVTEDDSKIIEQTFAIDTPKNDTSVKKTIKGKRVQKSPNNDLTDVRGVRRVMATPRPPKTPKNDLSDVRGVRKMMKTPKVANSPQNDLSNVTGIQWLLTSPEQNSPTNDLGDGKGVKRPAKTPRITNSPKNDLSNPPAFNHLYETAKSPANDLRDVRGVKRLLKTPKTVKGPKNDLTNIPAFKQMFDVQKSPANDLREVRGVKRLLKTPKTMKGPKNDLSNLPAIKHLFEPSKSPKNDLQDVKGVKGIMKTPKAPKSPRNDLRDLPEFKQVFGLQKSSSNGLEKLEGVKELMATPATLKSKKNLVDNGDGDHLSKTPKMGKSPRNNLREPYGIKTVFATPKSMNSPKNDLSDVEGTDMLMTTANISKSLGKLSSSSSLDKVLSAIQVPKTDRNRQSVLSTKHTPKSDYTDVRGVKRMFAEEEAMVRNIPNISGVASFFEANTPTSSEAFTMLFNKKPLRTYPSKSPPKLNKVRISRLDASPTEAAVSSDVVNWVNTVNEQLVDSDREKDEGPKSPTTERSVRLTSSTLTPRKSVDSPRKVHKEHLISSTPLPNKVDSEIEEATDELILKSTKKGILKEPNTGSPIVGSKRTRRNKNITETPKENLTPDVSDTVSDTQVKKVTFNVEKDETRRSQRTPRKPAKFAGFVSGLPSRSQKNKEENQQIPLLPDTNEPVAKQHSTRRRGTKPAEKETVESVEEPAVKKQEINQSENDQQPQTIPEKKSTKRLRGKQVDENEEESASKVVEAKKPAKRLRGKQVDENEEESASEVVEAKNPAKRLRRKQVDENEEESASEVVEAKNPTKRLRRKQVDENEEQSTSEVVEAKNPTKRLRRKQVDENEEQSASEVVEAKKPAKRLRSKQNHADIENVEQPENENPQTVIVESDENPSMRCPPKAKINSKAEHFENDSEVNEIKYPGEIRPVRTRGRRRKIAEKTETESESESSIQQKSVRRGRRNVNESQNDSELIGTKDAEQKPATRRTRKRIHEDEPAEVEHSTTESVEGEPVQKRGRRNGKIEQPEVVAKTVSSHARKTKQEAIEKHDNGDKESETQKKIVTRRGRNAKVGQPEKSNVGDKFQKPIPAKRGRKAAAEKEQESAEKSETANGSLRRTTRKAAAKKIDSVDNDSSVSSQGKGKRSRKEITEDAPIRKSARTRR